MQRIYLFMSNNNRVRAFTSDQTGDLLPEEYAPWRALNFGRPLVAAPIDPVAKAIQREGFFLVTASTRA